MLLVLRLIKLNPLYPDISMHCEHEYRRRGHKAKPKHLQTSQTAARSFIGGQQTACSQLLLKPLIYCDESCV